MSNSDLPKLLRGLGAAVLVASGVTFMLEGWGVLTSLGKYGAFMAFVLALSLAGVFCTLILKETKGARIFLGLATAALTAEFAQLGAMVQAQVQAGPQSSALPSFLVYSSPEAGLLYGLVAGTLALGAAVAWLGFASLARSQARAAAATFLALNLLLLVPGRDEIWALCATVAAAGGLLLLELRAFRRDAAMRTNEGWILRAILASPILALAGRQSFYPMSEAIVGIQLLVLALGIFALVPLVPLSQRFMRFSQGLSAALVWLGWGLCVGSGSGAPLLALPVAWAWIGMSRLSVGDRERFRNAGVVLALAGCGISLFQHPGAVSALLLILNGAALAALAVSIRGRFMLAAGFASAFLGLADTFRMALSLVSINAWLGLALLGTAVLLLSSCLERNGGRVRQAAGAARRAMSSWS